MAGASIPVARMMISAMEGDLEELKLATEKCDVNFRMGHDGLTAGHRAAAGGHLECLKYLFEKGYTPVADHQGETISHCAVVNGNVETVAFLIENGSMTANTKCSKGITPVHRAASNGHTEILRLLALKGDGDLGMIGPGGVSCLHLAAFRGHASTVRCLLEEFGFDVRVLDGSGDSAVSLAAKNSCTDVLAYLLITRPREIRTDDLKYALRRISKLPEKGMCSQQGMEEAVSSARKELRWRAVKYLYMISTRPNMRDEDHPHFPNPILDLPIEMVDCISRFLVT